jgi:hypothetical protein
MKWYKAYYAASRNQIRMFGFKKTCEVHLPVRSIKYEYACMYEYCKRCHDAPTRALLHSTHVPSSLQATDTQATIIENGLVLLFICSLLCAHMCQGATASISSNRTASYFHRVQFRAHWCSFTRIILPRPRTVIPLTTQPTCAMLRSSGSSQETESCN